MKIEEMQHVERRIQDILENKPLKGRPGIILNGKKLTKNQLTAIKEYHNVLKAKNLEPVTILNYLKELRHFFLTINKDPRNITPKDTARFLAEKTYSRKKFCYEKLEKFFEWFGKSEVTRGLKPQKSKKKKKPKNFLTPIEVNRMLGICDNFRDIALISLTMDAGLRAGEITALKVEDLEFDEWGMKVHVPETGKTGTRTTRLTDSIPALRNWLNNFPIKDEKGKPNPESYLFIKYKYAKGGKWYYTEGYKFKGIDHKGLTGNGFACIVKRIAEKSGIEKNVYPHLFRHSRAHQLLMEGWSIHEVQRHLGHSSITSTEGYINYRDEDYDNDVLKRKGLIDENGKKAQIDKSLEPKVCFHCSHKNPSHVQFCERCNGPITLKAIETVKARHTVRSVVKYEGLPENDRQALIKLVSSLFDKGILDPHDFREKV